MAKAKTTVKTKNLEKAPLASLSLEELQAELATTRNDQREAKLGHRQGELVNPRALTAKRKHIARLLTAITAKQREQAGTHQESSEEKS